MVYYIRNVKGDVVKSNECVIIDHTEQEFVVRIRSISGVGADNLKNLIQNRFEVIDIEEKEKTHFVK